MLHSAKPSRSDTWRRTFIFFLYCILYPFASKALYTQFQLTACSFFFSTGDFVAHRCLGWDCMWRMLLSTLLLLLGQYSCCCFCSCNFTYPSSNALQTQDTLTGFLIHEEKQLNILVYLVDMGHARYLNDYFLLPNFVLSTSLATRRKSWRYKL